MKTFKNKSFTKKYEDSTTVVYCKGNDAPNTDWIEIDELELDLSDAQHLWTQNSVRYYGYL